MSVMEPGYGPDEAFETVRARLSTPAALLLVLGAFGALGSCVNLLSAVLSTGRQNEELLRALVQDEAIVKQALAFASGPLSMVAALFGIVASAVIVAGSWKMYRVESYPLAVTAAVLSLVPCTSPCCCCVGMPVGLWALVILMDPKVQSAFR